MTVEQQRPAPLTPEDCNLRGFPWMALDTVRLMDSDLFLLATGDEFKAALALWCKSWSQVPAASLPNDERLLGALSGAKNWKKVRDMAMRGWVLCSDNRWYHPVVAEKALEALPARKAHTEHKAAAAERKERERVDRKRLFELLRAHGVVPEFTTSTTKLREIAAPYEAADKSRDVTRDKSHGVTAITGQDSTGQDSTFNSVPNGTGADGAAAPPPPPAEVPGAAKAMTALEAVAIMNRVDGAPLTDEDEKLLWSGGRALFSLHGISSENAAKFVGKLIKDNGNDRALVFDVIRAACLERPVDPRGWMTATCQSRRGQRFPTTNKQTALEDGNLAAAAQFAAGA